MNTLTQKDIKAIFKIISGIMQEEKDFLIELDSQMGDGDLGLTMSKGFMDVERALKEYQEQDIGKIFLKAGMVMAQSVPSTMGTLMATGLMRGGKAVAGKQELMFEDFTALWTGFVEGIMERGKSKPGDKTVIDSLYPAVSALREAVKSGATWKEGLQSAYGAAVKGVEETKEMVSQHGRAAYYQEKSLGKQDPGATVGMLVIKGFSDYVLNYIERTKDFT